MGPASLNTKQAWAQVSENGKVIYSSAGGPENQGHGSTLPAPLLEPLSWNQGMVCASRKCLQEPAAQKGQATGGQMKR